MPVTRTGKNEDDDLLFVWAEHVAAAEIIAMFLTVGSNWISFLRIPSPGVGMDVFIRTLFIYVTSSGEFNLFATLLNIS
jgi:hypothetical protein